MPRTLSKCPSCGKELETEKPVTSILFNGQVVSKGSRPDNESLCYLYHDTE